MSYEEEVDCPRCRPYYSFRGMGCFLCEGSGSVSNPVAVTFALDPDAALEMVADIVAKGGRVNRFTRNWQKDFKEQMDIQLAHHRERQREKDKQLERSR